MSEQGHPASEWPRWDLKQELARCDDKSKEGHRILAGGLLSFVPHFFSNTISWWYKPCTSAPPLSPSFGADHHLGEACKESLLFFSSPYWWNYCVATDSRPNQLKHLFLSACCGWSCMPLGWGWGGDWVYTGEDVVFRCLVFVFRQSWLAWTMKRKLKKKSHYLFGYTNDQWIQVHSGCEFWRAGKISVLCIVVS